MKKKIILLAALAVVLVGILVLLCIFAPGKAVGSGDTESLYAYGYSPEDDGILVTINGPFPAGSKWTANVSSGAAIVAEKGRQNARRARFTVTPLSNGPAEVVFTLNGGGEGGYQIEVDLYADKTWQYSVTGSTHREMEAPTGGELSDTLRYVLSQDADGSYLIILAAEENGSWECESSDTTSVTVTTVMNEEGVYSCKAEPATDSVVVDEEGNVTDIPATRNDATVRIFSAEREEELVVAFTYDENGRLCAAVSDGQSEQPAETAAE